MLELLLLADITLTPTIPGTSIQDFGASGYVEVYDAYGFGERVLAPTIPGTDIINYGKPGYIIKGPDNDLFLDPIIPENPYD